MQKGRGRRLAAAGARREHVAGVVDDDLAAGLAAPGGEEVAPPFVLVGEAERAPLFDSLLTDYSLGAGKGFTWVP